MDARLLIVTAALSIAACSKAGADAPRARPIAQVTVTKVEARDVDVEVRAPVDLRPLASADVVSKVLGYLDAVLVDRGDVVKVGQTLAIVRPSDLPDQLQAARGSLGTVAAQVGLARVNLDRAKQLAANGLASQQELQQATAALAAAEASEAAAKAQVGALGVRLGETKITSPLDGVVVTRKLDPGALVGPPGGGAIVGVARIDTLRVFIAVSEGDVRRVKVGQAAHVEIEGSPDLPIRGTVVRLAGAVDPTTRTLDAEVHVPNGDGKLRPGMYGHGAIILETHAKAAVVPAGAVQISGGKRYAFVLTGDKVARREIETGIDQGNTLEVTRGLAIGDEIVTAGYDGLADGTEVKAMRGMDPYTGKPIDAGTH